MMTQSEDPLVDGIMQVMDVAFEPNWGEAWSRKQVADALLLTNTYAVLVDKNGKIDPANSEECAGFCLSRAASDEEELLLIGVTPANRGRGLGKKLIDSLVKNARQRGIQRIYLEMRTNNPAENLYRLIGFEPIGKRPKYYRLADGNRMDAITFELTI